MKGDLLKRRRLEALQKGLSSDACIIEDPHNLFYLTGLKLSRGTLLITKNKKILYVDSRYKEMAKECSFLDVRQDSIDTKTVITNTKSLAFDPSTTSYERFCQLKKLFPSCKLLPSPDLFSSLRSIKSPHEIKLMEKSAQILWEGFFHIQSLLTPGVTEQKIAQELLCFCISKGASGWSFEPNISFGKNSALPHHRASLTKLKQGDVVLIDVGIIYEGYCSDMTRTLFFGTPHPKLQHLFDIVQGAHKKVLSLCKPGTLIGKLDEAARAIFKQKEVEELFIHALGHGIGLDVHEFPRIKYNGQDKSVLLQEGMVLCIEPGLYIPGLGGIRYEDTLLITKKGYKNFYVFDNK